MFALKQDASHLVTFLMDFLTTIWRTLHSSEESKRRLILDGLFQPFYSRYEFALGHVPVSTGETFQPSHIAATLITGRVIEVVLLRKRLLVLITVCS